MIITCWNVSRLEIFDHETMYSTVYSHDFYFAEERYAFTQLRQWQWTYIWKGGGTGEERA